jgi:hypothetical protein
MTCYKLSEQQANPLYDQLVNLFHELSTIIELSSLLTMDKKSYHHWLFLLWKLSI